MATLQANGTVLDRFEYENCAIAVMSNGHILRNTGGGWKRHRRAKPGVTAEAIAQKRRASYDARRAACPVWAQYIKLLCQLVSLPHRAELATLVDLMPGDPDGVWSMMDDRRVCLDLEDVVKLCELREAGEVELSAYKKANEIEN